MPLARPIEFALRKAVPLSLPVRYGAALGLVGASFALRYAADGWLAPGVLPYTAFLPAILVSGAILASGAAYVAAAASAFAGTFFVEPRGQFAVGTQDGIVTLLAFSAAACLTACITESLVNAYKARHAAERGKQLLLAEFRHRTRNDLQSLTSLLLLRARRASPEARVALKEAAAHALALANVHSRLTSAGAEDGRPFVDTCKFLVGLCEDLARHASADGLRPVAIDVDAQSHWISNERAVSLGLTVNETVANALKYAFPSADHGGRIRVRFERDNGSYALTVEDDGVGIAALAAMQGGSTSDGLGTRLLRSLAAQLRGSFTRGQGQHGGTICLLRFPTKEPGTA